MHPAKGDVEWLFVFARRVTALDETRMPEAARILSALAEAEVDPHERFDDLDGSLVVLLRAMAGMAEARTNSSGRSRRSHRPSGESSRR